MNYKEVFRHEARAVGFNPEMVDRLCENLDALLGHRQYQLYPRAKRIIESLQLLLDHARDPDRLLDKMRRDMNQVVFKLQMANLFYGNASGREQASRAILNEAFRFMDGLEGKLPVQAIHPAPSLR